MLIAIDDGHGKETAGKRTPPFPDGTIMKENEFNKIVAGYLEMELKRCGFSILQVAPEDTDVPLKTRVQRANAADVDLYVSIHANAYGSGWNQANGIETLVYSLNDAKTVDIASKVQKHLVADSGLRDRGVKEDPSLYVLNSTKMPAILCECGFMTNMKEAELLRSDAYRRKCAASICKGICEYYGVKYNNGVEVEEGGEKEMVEKAKIIIDGREFVVERILKDGTNYVKIRDVAEVMGYNVSSKGSIAVLTKK